MLLFNFITMRKNEQDWFQNWSFAFDRTSCGWWKKELLYCGPNFFVFEEPQEVHLPWENLWNLKTLITLYEQRRRKAAALQTDKAGINAEIGNEQAFMNIMKSDESLSAEKYATLELVGYAVYYSAIL